MDFSYYNKDNELIKFDLQIGTKWDDLNIKNDGLNSIFSKVDNGDREVTDQNELNLLEKLLKKADGILNATSKNNILENEELEEIEKQIEEGKITLPKRNNTDNTERSSIETVTHSEGFTKEEAQAIRNNEADIETIRQKYIAKIKADLKKYHHYDERFPEDRYEIDVKYNGRYYESFVYDKVSKTLSQGINFIREDGIEFSLKDHYNGDIADDENGDYSNVRQAANFGTFTLVDENGKSYELHYHMEELYGKDVLDCRRVAKIIGEYIADLPKETINKLIKNGIKDINFKSNYDDYDGEGVEEYIKNHIDKNGDVIDIPEEKYDDTATIISPKFAVPKREYKDLSFVRDDGFKIDIEDSSDSTSIIKITTPQGKQVTLDISSVTDENEYHQFQLPKLRNMLRDLPAQVLLDLSDEITGVKFIDKWAHMDAGYIKGTNQIAFTYNIGAMAQTMSFVHELGHAIDNQNGTMLSQSPEFTQKFDRLKELANKLDINNRNHALDLAEEFFASMYAYLELPDDESVANHIKKLEEKILKFKDSENPEEKECYELFQSLKEDVKIMVEQARKQPSTQRADNTIPDLVKSECKELITEFNNYHHFLKSYFDAQYVELDMISILSADDESFNKKMEYYRKIQTNELEDWLGNHPDLPEDIQNLFGEMADKLQELRTRIKQK